MPSRLHAFLRHRFCLPILLGIILGGCSNPTRQASSGFDGSVWVTSADRSKLMTRLPERLVFSEEVNEPGSLSTIDIDPVQRLQVMDGFGFTLTGGSAWLINSLPEPGRENLLKELFRIDESNIGISYLRVSIGSSDLDDHPFTYDDVPPGQTDVALAKFSLSVSEQHLIPVLKKIHALNPGIKIMATPWSAPAWMKTNRSLKGGTLKPAYYDAYAAYFVRYIRAMAAHGISIDAITIQNEPENGANNPSMLMTAAEQAFFIKDHLGPAFKKDTISAKIVAYDHNCDNPQYAIQVMDDPAANKFIAGAAFHLYDGHIDSLSVVHLSHPDRNIYFTEQYTSAREAFGKDLMWHTRNIIIGAPRNWSVNALEWNLASDPAFRPHTNGGGCTDCKGALTIGKNITRNVSYYIIAQASKFVRPGSVRVASTTSAGLMNVAFVTPDEKKVLIVLNETNKAADFAIKCQGQSAKASIPGHSVATFIW